MSAFALLAPLGALLASFIGLPIAMPPAKEEPLMARVAPADCVAYASWAARVEPSARSNNQTEQLLAEPEVQAFAANLQQNILGAAIAAAKASGAPAEQTEKVAAAIDLFVRTLFTRSGAAFISRLEPNAKGVDVQAGLLINGGDSAAQLEQSLTDLIVLSGVTVSQETHIGYRFRKVSLPADEPLDIVWAAVNGNLMIGIGPRAIEDLNGRIQTGKEPAWLTQLKTNLPIERRSTVSYVNIKRLMQSFLPLGGMDAEKVVAALGLKQLISLQSTSGLDQVGMSSRSLLAWDGQPQGVLTLLDDKGIAAGNLSHIPADSMTAVAMSFDLRKIFDFTLAAMKQIEPEAEEQARQSLALAQNMLGIDIAESLAALGTHWSLHVPTADGGGMATALVVEVRDQNRLLNLEKTLLSRLSTATGDIQGVGRVTKTPFGRYSITSLTMQTPLPFVPCWCITADKLVVGINPQAIKSVLSRQPADKSVAELPEVASRLSANNGGGPLLVTFQDTPKAFAGMYAQLQIFLPMINGMAQQNNVPFNLDVATLPAQRTIGRHLRPSVTSIRRTARGLEFETQQTFPGLSVSPATTGVMVALLLPAVQAAREAARRTQSANNIKQQLLALHNYHDTFGTLPPAFTTSSDGKPLLSWRVAILPFIEQKALYDQFHHDEPWDSEHNKQFITKIPQVFTSPNHSAKPGMTNYLAVGGLHGSLAKPSAPGSKTGRRFADFIDGLANTIAIVEATDALAVEWTKPVEWIPDEKEPIQGLLGMRPNGFLAGFVDGHVEFIAKSIEPEMLRRAFSRDDRQPITWPGEGAKAAPGRVPGPVAPPQPAQPQPRPRER